MENQDRYYLDYRIGTIVKNLDTRTLPPEAFIEIVVSDLLDGVYVYTFEDHEQKRLNFQFAAEQTTAHDWDFFKAVDAHCRLHNFNNIKTIRRELHISKDRFDKCEKDWE